jgi:hypothetical protein
MQHLCGSNPRAEGNCLITPTFIRDLVTLGGYSEAATNSIEKILKREREPKVSDRDRVALVFTERCQGRWQYDRTNRRWLEDGKVDQVRKVFDVIRQISRELNHKGKRGMGSAQFIDNVRRYLQNSPEFEVFPPPVKPRRRVS